MPPISNALINAIAQQGLRPAGFTPPRAGLVGETLYPTPVRTGDTPSSLGARFSPEFPAPVPQYGKGEAADMGWGALAPVGIAGLSLLSRPGFDEATQMATPSFIEGLGLGGGSGAGSGWFSAGEGGILGPGGIGDLYSGLAGTGGSLLSGYLAPQIFDGDPTAVGWGQGIGSTLGAIGGSYFGPVGSFAGSTIGGLLGGGIGSLIGGEPSVSVGPNAGANVEFDTESGLFVNAGAGADNFGDVRLATGMANELRRKLNDLNETLGGDRFSGEINMQIGHFGGNLTSSFGGELPGSISSNNTRDLVDLTITDLLQQPDVFNSEGLSESILEAIDRGASARTISRLAKIEAAENAPPIEPDPEAAKKSGRVGERIFA